MAVCGTVRRGAARACEAHPAHVRRKAVAMRHGAWHGRLARGFRGRRDPGGSFEHGQDGRATHGQDARAANGLPSGKVGLVASKAGTKFSALQISDYADWADMLGRWRNGSPQTSFRVSGDKLDLGGNDMRYGPPNVLANFHAEKFRATMRMTRIGSSGYAYFAFHASDPDQYNILRLKHTSSASGSAPYGYEIVDGGALSIIDSPYYRYDANTPLMAAASDALWYRVSFDGGEVIVRALDAAGVADPPTEPQWSAADVCFRADADRYARTDGGSLGFTGGYAYIDDMTVEGWDADANDWLVQAVETFNIDANGHAGHQPAHDEAGSMVYDGQYQYTFDAWNRLAKVERAWRDDANNAIQTGSTIAEIQYDGLHRRTIKKISNSGDWDATYQYTWSTNWQLLETRNGEDQVLKQHLWGPRYVDEIVQIAVNTDPETDANCESAYYPMQNANFNVLGVADANGVLVERYEYTPYGQRRVYTKAGANDPLTTAPLYDSQPASENHPHSICDLGHQGLPHEKEFGLIYIRNRYGDPDGRWGQRDIEGYVDGMNLYEYVFGSPVNWVDLLGAQAQKPKWNKKEGETYEEYVKKIRAYEARDSQTNEILRQTRERSAEAKRLVAIGSGQDPRSPKFVAVKTLEVNLGKVVPISPGSTAVKEAKEKLQEYGREYGGFEEVTVHEEDRWLQPWSTLESEFAGYSGFSFAVTLKAKVVGGCCDFGGSTYLFMAFFAYTSGDFTTFHSVPEGPIDAIVFRNTREHELGHTDGITKKLDILEKAEKLKKAGWDRDEWEFSGTVGYRGEALKRIEKAKHAFKNFVSPPDATEAKCLMRARDILNTHLLSDVAQDDILQGGLFHGGTGKSKHDLKVEKKD